MNLLVLEPLDAEVVEWLGRRHAVRVAPELARNPAFNEDIDTVTGKPHGNILYSWNSGFWWLRKEIRRRLGHTGPDPVGLAIDAKLGVVRENGMLRLSFEKQSTR